MKKVMALALAMILTMGLSSVAFATVDNAEVDKYYVQDSIYVENSDGVIVNQGKSEAGATIKPEKTVYMPIVKGADDAYATADNKDEVKKLKAYAEWTVGKPEGNPTIEYKKLNMNGTEGYYYVVAVKLPANSNVKSYDLNGTINVGRTKKQAIDEPSHEAAALNIAVGYKVGSTNFSGGDISSDAPIVEFEDNCGDIEITWGDDLAMFDVNATGQSKLNLDYSTKFNADFAGKYDYANIDFVNFTQSPAFNRTGTLYIYADKDTFIYEVTPNGAKAIKDAKYDESQGAWVFKTRTLGSYAISDKELKTVTSSSSSSSSTSAPTEEPSSSAPSTAKPNPDTGR